MELITKTRNGKNTVFGEHGRIEVKGSHMVDKNGEQVVLRGISSHNLNTFPEYCTRENMEFMADKWGMSIFRLAMYSAEADDCKGYSDGDDAHRAELEEIIDRCVKAAAELGIYLLIDWHILLDPNPNTHKDMALKFFEKMSKLYAGYDNVIYEICNEPNTNCPWTDIKSYAEEVIPVIRANAPQSLIVVGTPQWSQDVDVAADSPLAFENLAYTVHFYAATHTQWLRDKATYAMNKGLAVFVTEFGTCDASGNGAYDEEEAKRWTDFMNGNGISHIIWNLSNKKESSAMIQPECKKTTGFLDEELTECGKWYLENMR